MLIEFITIKYAFVNVGNSIREKRHILMRSVLSADKTPQEEEEVYRYKVTAHDVLSTI